MSARMCIVLNIATGKTFRIPESTMEIYRKNPLTEKQYQFQCFVGETKIKENEKPKEKIRLKKIEPEKINETDESGITSDAGSESDFPGNESGNNTGTEIIEDVEIKGQTKPRKSGKPKPKSGKHKPRKS